MMRIYFGHSQNFDFVNELYIPLRESELNSKVELIFPHETDDYLRAEEVLKNVDMLIAEVSFPATGLGIEIGYAHMYKIPIIAVHKNKAKVSESVKSRASHIIEYNDIEDLVSRLLPFLAN